MSNTEWKKVKLGDIIVKMGKTEHPAKDALDSGKYPFFTNSASEKKFYINDFDFDEPIILANTGGKAYFKYCDVKCSASRDLYIFKTVPDVDVKYLYYVLKDMEQDINDNGFAGAALKHLNKDYLHSREISLPSLEEQRRIASLLSRFDELIQLHEFKAENLIKAKQQIMSDIFSGGLRELESINPDAYVQDNWVTVKLGDIGKCIRGLSYKKDDVSDKGTLVIRSNNIELGKCVNTETDLQFVTKECKSEQELIAGDIVVCTANGSIRLVGKSSYYDGKYTGKITCGAFCAIYRSNNPLVRWLFQSRDYAEQLNTIVHGGEGSINNLKLSDVLNMQFKIPPTIEEQRKIANILSSYDSLIELKRSQKQQVTNMKQQLMSQLLTNGGGAEQLGNC